MEFTRIVMDLLSTNRGPDPSAPDKPIAPDYGIQAVLADSILVMTLPFRSNAAYCCMEWGCHLPLDRDKRWERLRQRCADSRVSTPDRFELQLSVHVEDGARFFDFSRPDPDRRGWYAFKPAAMWKYEVCSTEAGVA